MPTAHLLASLCQLRILLVRTDVHVRVHLAEQLVEQVLGPHYAVDGLRDCIGLD